MLAHMHSGASPSRQAPARCRGSSALDRAREQADTQWLRERTFPRWASGDWSGRELTGSAHGSVQSVLEMVPRTNAAEPMRNPRDVGKTSLITIDR
jgi:hypothetical protein